MLVITPIYAATVIAPSGGPDEKTAYALLETGVGLGNLVAGFLIGLVGARLAKGRMVIAGFVIDGLSLAGLGLVGRARCFSSKRSRRIRWSRPWTKFQAPMFPGSSCTHHTCRAFGYRSRMARICSSGHG